MADPATPVPQIALPSQSEPIIDRYRRWTPAWWKWIKPLLEVTNDNSKKLFAQATNIEEINAAIEEERVVRADADGAMARDIATITANYQGADELLDVTFTAKIEEEKTARSDADGALSTRVDNVEADYQAADFTLQSNISSEAQARSDADGGLASRIDVVETNYQSEDSLLSAAIESEATARIAADGVLAGTVETVSTTVDDLTTTVSEQTTSINGVLGKWGVKINSNDRVSGLELNSGLNALSTFSVLSDIFEVVHPTDDGASIKPFVSEVVEGVGTVRINGNLLVSKSIDASAINTDKLSAITTNLGTVTAGLIQNPAATLKFDLPNMRIYRTDGKFDLNAAAGYLIMKP